MLLWILQGLLGLAFFASGAMKLATARDKLMKQKGMGFAADFSATQIELIGGAEVLGAVGLVVPWATGIVPVLTPIAAAGLVAIMVGGAIVHLRRREQPFPPILLGGLAALVAIGRSGAFR